MNDVKLEPQMDADARRLGRKTGLFSRRSFYLCISLLICSFTSIVRADWTLTTSDFKTQAKLTVNTWTPGEGLSVSAEDGGLIKTDSRRIVSLVSDRPKAPANGNWTLVLRNGDVLDGEPVGVSGQSLQFKITELGPIDIPLKNLATMQSKDNKNPLSSTATDKDLVRLKNGDQVEGFFINVNTDKLQITTNANDSATTDIELSKVDRIAFGGVSPARAVPPLSARLTFLSGSTLTVPLTDKNKTFSWSVGDITLKDPAGQERKTTPDQVSAVEVLGGRVVFLTEIDPASDQQTSYLGTVWPTQVNKNVLGGTLKVGKNIFGRGLGVHTRSILTYDLQAAGGKFDALTLRAGLDDSSAPYGEANLSIVLDGKVLWEAKGMKAGQISEELNLPLKEGKMLELHAEPAGKLDVLGRVDWVNAALIRP